MITATLRAIYKVNLAVKNGEQVLVFTDIPSPREVIHANDLCRRERLRDIALLTAEIGKAFTRKIVYCEYYATGSHGAEPPPVLWVHAFGDKAVAEMEQKGIFPQLLRKELSVQHMKEAESIVYRHRRHAVNVVIGLANYSTSHTRFRDFLTRVCGCRYASMPLFDAQMLEVSMNVDWKALSKRTAVVAQVLSKAVSINITTPNGTRMSFSKKGRKVVSDTGMLVKKGDFGNMPAGEVFLAPAEGSARGSLVLEWAPTRALASPVTLTVKGGFVTEIFGEDPYADYLRLKISERRDNGNIAEFGIGTNEMARRADNVLESEKILGTIHIALGDNSSFGGRVSTPFHQDFVFFKPTVVLIGKDGEETCLLRNGTLLV